MPKKREKPRRELTKRQMSHWEKEKRRQRVIFFSGISIITIVILVVLGSWMYFEFLPMNKTVIRVNDRAFKMSYYIDMVEFYSIYGRSSSSERPNPAGVIEDVARAIEQNEIARKDAARLGVTVSDSEVDKARTSRTPPASKKFTDPIETQLVVSKMQTDYFEKQVPQSAAQRHVQAMFLESESQAREVKKRLDAGESFETLATELTLDGLTKQQKGDLGWRPAGMIGTDFGLPKVEQYAFSAEAGFVSEPLFDDSHQKSLGYWILKVSERQSEPTKQATVQGILLGNEEDARKAKARLDAGEDFAALAKEVSLHTATKEAGGDRGPVAPDSLPKPQSDFIFGEKAELNKPSDPIKDDTVNTQGGYWLIKVVEISDDRPLDEQNRNILKNKQLSEWFNGLLTDPAYTIEESLTDEQKRFALSKVEERLKSITGAR